MKKQYIHDHYFKDNGKGYYLLKDNPKTFAFELPDYDLIETEIMKSITDNNYLSIVSFGVGVARQHPNDDYIKSVGREIADSKIEMITFTVQRIYMYPEDNEILISLYNIEKGLNVKLVLKKEYRNVRILTTYFDYEK